MKKTFLFILPALINLSTIYGQTKDSLVLDIKSLKKTGIILKYSGAPPLTLSEDPNKINFSSTSWTFSIRSQPLQNAYAVVSNTEGEVISSAKLTDINRSYSIRNDSFIGTEFSIKGTIKIEVFNKANDQLIKSFPITFGQAEEEDLRIQNSKEAVDYKPGSLVHDALYLANGAVKGKKIKILSYYGLQKKDTQNKFLAALIDTLIGKSTPHSSLSLGSVFSSIGGLDVTGFADGAAKFIVKRAKQELSIAFFQKFKKVIDSTRDIGTVFPQTANLLNVMDEEIYEYEKYIQNLRESFKKDLTEIHRNLPGIIDNHPEFFSNHQPVKAALLTACYTAQSLEDQSHPGDILANYPVNYLDSISNKNYKGAIQTVQLLSASLRDTATKEDADYWVGIKKMRELVNDKEALKFYLGLLLQEAKNKYENIPYEATSLVTLLNEVGRRYDAGFGIYNSYRSYVLRFGEKLDALNKMIKEYSKENTSDSAVLEKYAKYFRTSVDMVEYCTQTSTLPIIKDHLPNLKALLGKYFSLAYAAADMVVDINRKNYSAVINHAVHIYNVVTVKAVEEPSVSVSSPLMASISSDQKATYIKNFKNSLNRLIRYGSFIATIATAKNSDEVAMAIEAAALPVGSSRIKRVADFNVSLNAYAGLFYGVERIQDLDSGRWNANVYGITAPIGVAASFGHRLLFFKTKQEWSTSLFISLIDLGAVAAFRFTDDSTSQIPTIRLKNIFSPGAFLSIGIPQTPLSLSLGAQVGPNLRKVAADPLKGNNFSDKIYWRFSTSLAVDIPILNFHTRSK